MTTNPDHTPERYWPGIYGEEAKARIAEGCPEQAAGAAMAAASAAHRHNPDLRDEPSSLEELVPQKPRAVAVPPEFTLSAYERSHGFKPRGRGFWVFQRATNYTAFDRELVGEIFFAPYGTLTEAKRWLVEHHGGGIWAVMP
jgi:hypothetical protein